MCGLRRAPITSSDEMKAPNGRIFFVAVNHRSEREVKKFVPT